MKYKRQSLCPLHAFSLPHPIAWSQEYNEMQKFFCVCLAFSGYLLSIWCHKMAPWALHHNRILLCFSPYPSSSTRCIFRKKNQSKGFILTTFKMDLWPRLPQTALVRVKKEAKHQQGPLLLCTFSFDALETLGRGHLSRSSSSGSLIGSRCRRWANLGHSKSSNPSISYLCYAMARIPSRLRNKHSLINSIMESGLVSKVYIISGAREVEAGRLQIQGQFRY